MELSRSQTMVTYNYLLNGNSVEEKAENIDLIANTHFQKIVGGAFGWSRGGFLSTNGLPYLHFCFPDSARAKTCTMRMQGMWIWNYPLKRSDGSRCELNKNQLSSYSCKWSQIKCTFLHDYVILVVLTNKIIDSTHAEIQTQFKI